MEYKDVRKDKETGAKVTRIWQENGWCVEIWEYPDGTRDEFIIGR